MSRIDANPFHVLEVRPGSSAVEIERAGAKLIGMLATGFEEAATFRTPLGPRPRDADLVRRSLDALRDPAKRRIHERWATLAPIDAPQPPDPARTPWPEVFAVLGWAPPSGRQ